MPSIEAMLITLAGLSALAAARNGAASALVRKNGVLRLRFCDLVPAALREFVELGAPRRARIVDEDVQFGFALLDLGRQHLDAGQIGNVDRQCDAFAVILRRELFRAGLARSRLARGDIDPHSTMREKAGRDHLADAARAAAHQRDPALQ
jgi:hypothetical protein